MADEQNHPVEPLEAKRAQTAVEHDPAGDATCLSELLARRLNHTVSPTSSMVRAWVESLPREDEVLLDSESPKFSGSAQSVVQQLMKP